jgi:chaperonin GroES
LAEVEELVLTVHLFSPYVQLSTIRSIKSVAPLLDRILVQRFKPQEKTVSGIFLPSSSTSSPLPEASVIAAGPGARGDDGKLIPTSVKVGDKVLMPGFGGQKIVIGEEVSVLPP